MVSPCLFAVLGQPPLAEHLRLQPLETTYPYPSPAHTVTVTAMSIETGSQLRTWIAATFGWLAPDCRQIV
jgi:hypothetical protein